METLDENICKKMSVMLCKSPSLKSKFTDLIELVTHFKKTKIP